ncbi:MAG: SDR family NAD(P)-dependent oxidoreductase [Planctomycetota bacterium]|jgi:3-oxoacyl-[acyl-carrier protein] reductase
MNTTSKPLAGKTAIVTGAGRGIGQAIAVAFASAGANVCAAARSRDQIEAVVSEIQAAGGQAIAVECDVTDLAAVERLVEATVTEFDGLNILVNNAGVGLERRIVGDDEPDLWKQTVEINLFGVYHCIRAALPHLKASKGSIINIGSGMGHQARNVNSSYNVSKAGLWMLTECLALQLADDGVCINEVIPGPVETPLTTNLFQAGKPHPTIPTEFVKLPEDVVPLAMYLATQPPTGPTGQSFSLARRPL